FLIHVQRHRPAPRGRVPIARRSRRHPLVLPAHFESFPEFFVGHVQVALRLLDARVSEHQLDDARPTASPGTPRSVGGSPSAESAALRSFSPYEALPNRVIE